MSDAKYENSKLASIWARNNCMKLCVERVGTVLTAILTINDAKQDLRLRIYRFGVPAATKPSGQFPAQRNHE